MTHGLSAREAAEQVVRHFPALLGPGASGSGAGAPSASLDWNDAGGVGSLGLSH
jgi:hypothetical protein